MKTETVQWQIHQFEELNPVALYEMLHLRSKVFVVEQGCSYLDLDYKDMESLHLMGKKKNKLVAYARIAPPGLIYEQASIGRIVLDKKQRGKGMGSLIVELAIEEVHRRFGENSAIKIMAQEHLKLFYKKHNFKPVGEVFLDAGIPHLEMILTRQASATN